MEVRNGGGEMSMRIPLRVATVFVFAAATACVDESHSSDSGDLADHDAPVIGQAKCCMSR